MALLAHAPISLKNFAALNLGTSFQRIGDRWWIVLGRRETKSGAADERPVPAYLNQAIAIYLSLARPILLGRREFIIGDEDQSGEARSILAGGLWIGAGGERLGYSAVGQAIMGTTRQTIGRALSPTTSGVAVRPPHASTPGSEPHLASGLLHQRDRTVTENYILATSLAAAQRFADIVEALL